MKLVHAQPPVWPEIPQGRFAQSIRRDSPIGCRVALVGLPDDLGVRLNHGRPGAALGPESFRTAFARYGSSFDLDSATDLASIGVFDAGDIIPAKGDNPAALQQTHERVTESLRAVHSQGLIPLCVGGGHDLTFPTVRALAQHAGGPVGGVNIDPHLDVRETPGSGMPFRSLIEEGHLDAARFSVLGAGAFTNAKPHIDWLHSRGGAVVPLDACRMDLDRAFDSALQRALGKAAGPRAFVSFDLDSLDACYAPGVSALNPAGMTPHEMARLARAAGRHPAVMHIDFMELNPAHDDQGRTARILAFLFLHVLAGLAERFHLAEPAS